MKKLSALVVCLILIITLFDGVHANTEITGWDTYSDTWALYDGLGREMPSNVKKPNEKKYVLMLYHIWHVDFMRPTLGADRKAPRNITKIISENKDAISDRTLWGPEISYHYWGEPLFGYYDLSNDEYVIRKHAQMLTDSGVDSIVIDYSNFMGTKNFNYTKQALINLLDVLNKIIDEGGDIPYVTLLCTWDAVGSESAATAFYEDFYTNKKYDRLWFKWEGKPLLLAHPDNLSEEINEFFTIRKPFPFYTDVNEINTWPWLSIYPQKPGYTKDNKCEIVSVSVAQNWTDALDFMSAQDENGNFIARGRSYTIKNQKLLKDPTSKEYESEKGENFQQCFDRAIEMDPTALFVTGWNEWIAARFVKIPDWAKMSQNEVPASGGFCDAFTTEFSRDIEPTREGDLLDHFYNQLSINIRRFKGSGEPLNSVVEKTIGMDGSFEDWKSVKLEYRDDISDCSCRNATGIGKDNVYINTSGRNDIKLSKVTYDKDNIYFYVNTSNPITLHTDPMWMNLYIRVKGVNAYDKSWEGFQYIINRSSVTEENTTLERSLGGWNWENLNTDIPYNVDKNEMEIAIPLKDLGIDYNKGIDIEFKWFDNMQVEGDVLDFYINGDTAPNERFSYSFKSISVKETKNSVTPNVFIPIIILIIFSLVLILVIVKKKRGQL